MLTTSIYRSFIGFNDSDPLSALRFFPQLTFFLTSVFLRSIFGPSSVRLRFLARERQRVTWPWRFLRRVFLFWTSRGNRGGLVCFIKWQYVTQIMNKNRQACHCDIIYTFSFCHLFSDPSHFNLDSISRNHSDFSRIGPKWKKWRKETNEAL